MSIKVKQVEQQELTKIQLFKLELKRLAEEQKTLKLNRKTVHITVERTVDASTAAWKAVHNKVDLRAMYVAYGLLRGKDVSVTETKATKKQPTEVNQTLVDKYLKEYGEPEKVVPGN